MEKFTITATIPTVQYGNIQPTIEVEADTYEEAKTIGLARMEDIWGKYAQIPLPKKTDEGFLILDTFTGEKIKYNAETHQYTDLEGTKLVSGSEYKKSFDKPFPRDFLAGKVATKYGVPTETVISMWEANSKISTTFGNSIHYSMEQWFKFRASGCDDKQYNLPKHPFLRAMVEAFPHKDNNVIPEVLVSCVKERMSGQIDGILVIDAEKKICRVIDYKSDADIQKNLDGHFIQLSFYAKILTLAGWSVEMLEVWNYTDGWKSYESAPLEVGEITSSNLK